MIRELKLGEEYLVIYDEPGALEKCTEWLRSHKLSVVADEIEPFKQGRQKRVLIVKQLDNPDTNFIDAISKQE